VKKPVQRRKAKPSPTPSKASDAEAAGWEVGGPIPWFSVGLAIYGEDLDPDEVTRLLGIAPDRAFRRGMLNEAGRPRRFGMWSISMRGDSTTEPDVCVAIEMLLDRIRVAPDLWRVAVTDAQTMRVSAGLKLDAFNRGLDMRPDLLRRLADLRLELSLDIYAADDYAGQH
jgi:hypothetical protein